MPSGPKMKLVNALWVTTCWPEWPVWVRSTTAVAYLGEAFLSPSKVKSRSRPVAVSPPERAAPRRVDQALAAADEIVGEFARMLEEGVGLDVDDLELGGVERAPASAKSMTPAAQREAALMTPPSRCAK